MHSRAVLFMSLFAFACLVMLGSIALHLTSASATTGEAAAERLDHATSEPEAIPPSGPEVNTGFFREASGSSSSDDERLRAELGSRDRSIADSLAVLLRHVHIAFEPEGSDVSNAMIPYLAEMIMLINQHDHLVYSIEIVEPDAALAQRRAQTLNNVLRLNLLEPAKLRIVGRPGLHAALVDASASST